MTAGNVLHPVKFSEVALGKFGANRLVELGGVQYHLYAAMSGYYIVYTGSGYYSVHTGRWIKNLRSFGKTFYKLAKIEAHYKRHGTRLRELCAELRRLADERTADAGVR